MVERRRDDQPVVTQFEVDGSDYSPVTAVATHHSSHTKLFRPLEPTSDMPRTPPPLDAVLVTTCRHSSAPRSGIRTAVDIATRRNCPVIFLVAGTATAEDSVEHLGAMHPRAVVIDVDAHLDALPEPFTVDVALSLRLSSVAKPGRGSAAASSIGQSRNLGLALARAMGWERVLFLDDDVFPASGVGEAQRLGAGVLPAMTLDDAGLDLALRATVRGRTRAVGWSLRDFDDNSVVCRARGEEGYPQGQSIGGGALLVRCSGFLPFFPSVYNEDWLFLLGLRYHKRGTSRVWLSSKDVVLLGGSVRQDPYHPYEPGRARWEEFGDVMAEGLFSVVHPDSLTYFERLSRKARRNPFCEGIRNRDYWAEVVRCRAAMLARLIEDVDKVGEQERPEVEAALLEARQAHHDLFWVPAEDTAGRGVRVLNEGAIAFLAEYAGRYKRDEDRWMRFLDSVDNDWVRVSLGVCDQQRERLRVRMDNLVQQ